jgi:hypothetical protein
VFFQKNKKDSRKRSANKSAKSTIKAADGDANETLDPADVVRRISCVQV